LGKMKPTSGRGGEEGRTVSKGKTRKTSTKNTRGEVGKIKKFLVIFLV